MRRQQQAPTTNPTDGEYGGQSVQELLAQEPKKIALPGPATLVGDATRVHKAGLGPEDGEDPVVKKFEVIKGGKFLCSTTKTRTELKEGKVIDSRNYNLREVQQAGIKLKEVQESKVDESEFVGVD